MVFLQWPKLENKPSINPLAIFLCWHLEYEGDSVHMDPVLQLVYVSDKTCEGEDADSVDKY